MILSCFAVRYRRSTSDWSPTHQPTLLHGRSPSTSQLPAPTSLPPSAAPHAVPYPARGASHVYEATVYARIF